MTELYDEDFEKIAWKARASLGIDEQLRFDPIGALEAAKRIGLIVDWQILPDEIMGEVRGHYDPEKKVIYLSKGSQEGAARMAPRDGYTVAHELAHRLLNHARPRNRSAVLSKIERIHPRTRRRIEQRSASLHRCSPPIIEPTSPYRQPRRR